MDPVSGVIKMLSEVAKNSNVLRSLNGKVIVQRGASPTNTTTEDSMRNDWRAGRLALERTKIE